MYTILFGCIKENVRRAQHVSEKGGAKLPHQAFACEGVDGAGFEREFKLLG
jgi:hypothetical protein